MPLWFTTVFSQNWFQLQRIEKQFNQAVTHYNEGRYAIAHSLLDNVLESPSGEYEAPTLLLSMKTRLGLNQYESAKKLGRIFLTNYPESPYVKDVFLSYGDIFINQGHFPSAYRMMHRSRKIGVDSTFIAKLDYRILKLIQLNLPLELFLEQLSVETEEIPRIIHSIALAYSHIQNGAPDECAVALSAVSPEQIPEIYLSLYEKLLRASYQPPQPVTLVGMVLPLSGQDSDNGKKYLSGFQSRILKSPHADRRWPIMVMDNESDPFQTVQAVRKLSEFQNVTAIVGPLKDNTVLTATASMKDENIPLLIPGSTRNGLDILYDHLFQLNGNLSIRGKLAARYAILNLGLDSLAVISPADEFGQQLTDAFIKEVDRLGKTVVLTEWYSGTPKNLSRQFKSLRKMAFSLLPVEKNYDEFLGMEIDSLDALFDISADDFFNLPPIEEKKLSKSDSAKIVLSTIQGIYLPIHKGDLEYLGPQFPMYYLDTKLIGNEHWQNLDMLTKEHIGPHVKGISLITNSYYRGMDSTTVNDKSEEFISGYDTAGILSSLSFKENSRKSIADALSNLKHYKGVSQYYSSKSDRPNVNIALQILEFNGDTYIHRGYFSGDSLYLNTIDTP